MKIIDAFVFKAVQRIRPGLVVRITFFKKAWVCRLSNQLLKILIPLFKSELLNLADPNII
jgi:hypothetical protein